MSITIKMSYPWYSILRKSYGSWRYYFVISG